jgi:hypothetical protein
MQVNGKTDIIFIIVGELTEKLGAPRSACLLVAESATGKVLTQHILYRVLGLRW